MLYSYSKYFFKESKIDFFSIESSSFIHYFQLLSKSNFDGSSSFIDNSTTILLEVVVIELTCNDNDAGVCEKKILI